MLILFTKLTKKYQNNIYMHNIGVQGKEKSYLTFLQVKKEKVILASL